MVALSAWVTAGGVLDGWAHYHLAIKGFITPWHALIYTGATANALVLGTWWWRSGRRLPRGYGLALFGCVLGLASGISDFLWHARYGIEFDFAGALSPPHLGLFLSTGLVVSGVFRAAWHGPDRYLSWPAAVSAALLMEASLFTFQSMNPFTAEWSNPAFTPETPVRETEMLGTEDMVLTTLIIGLFLLLVVKRFRIRPGQLLLMIGASLSLIVLIHGTAKIVVVAWLAGAVAEGLYVVLRPGRRRGLAARLWLSLTVAYMWGTYQWTSIAAHGSRWIPSVDYGVVVLTVGVAFLSSYAVFAPERAMSAVETEDAFDFRTAPERSHEREPAAAARS